MASSSTNSVAGPSNPQQQARYECDYEERCGGVLRAVSRATYYGHAKYRQARLRAGLEDVLRESFTASRSSHQMREDAHRSKRRLLEDGMEQAIL